MGKKSLPIPPNHLKYIWLLNSLPKDIVKILCIHLKQNQYIEDTAKGEAELSITSIPF